MAYIGQTPSAVPLVAGDITDGIISEAKLAADAVSLAKMKAGTDGNIISYDASGNPVAIATGTDGQVLTSTGAGSPPAFEAAPSNPYLHTVQTHVIVASSQSISAGAVTNITSLNATITPTSGTKILITVRWNGEGSHSEGHAYIFGLRRDSTIIGSPSAASNRLVGLAVVTTSHSTDVNSTPDACFYQYLDSPSTGSAITYHATIVHGAGSTVSNNRSSDDTDSVNFERLTSTITLQEVVAP